PSPYTRRPALPESGEPGLLPEPREHGPYPHPTEPAAEVPYPPYRDPYLYPFTAPAPAPAPAAPYDGRPGSASGAVGYGRTDPPARTPPRTA
ncbi:hypothetical protein G3I46_02140, partial [Streptomyces coelicoflavus]|nr:hypothetical protein [Streptomyces coelicoflavus]